MADIRTNLARLLYQHQEGTTSNLDTGNEECRCGFQGDVVWRYHLVDVLLSLPGIAIVELPEDDACWTIDDVCNVSVYRGELGIVLRPGEYGVELINVGLDLVMVPAESRQLAAALLAAAAAAEAADNG